MIKIVQTYQYSKFAPAANVVGAAKKKARVSPRRTTYFWLGSRQTYTLRSGAVGEIF
jgi:hypothetical protein